ncbi:NADPH-dependent FMN reductase [Tellurirhabdus bombi]|uniref:NADPH-dependent FMN reductase n=1 Tax=Tellurirhabdus bombi TaxID=2907205 RepID=UPI001F2071F9|nr:NADPH-dependent FMN reductase [Tellurirhabdus bombi]
MYKLKIISSTVRSGRKGPIITSWIADAAREHGGFDVDVLDLAEINLPFMNEAAHPRLQQYEHEHTKQWSATIDEADAFVFVVGEYNHNFPAPLHNALEYLVQEWGYKAAGIVSYGGLSGGTRAASSLKGYIPTFKMVPIAEMVHLPFFTKNINDQDEFVADESVQRSATAMLNELLRWTKGLKLIKENKL